MFCSVKCREESYRKFNHKDASIIESLQGDEIRQKMLRIMGECLSIAGSFVELQKLVADINDGASVFDFDLQNVDGDEIRRNLLICVTSLMSKRDFGINEHLRKLLQKSEGERNDFLASFVSRIILNYLRNGAKILGKNRGEILGKIDGGVILPFVALVNHSCDANVFASFIDNKCVFTVMQTIEAGEQIFINYRKTFVERSKKERQAELLKSYEFDCNCSACAGNFPKPNKLRKVDSNFKLPDFGYFGSNEEIMKQLRKNFRYAKFWSHQHPSFETCAVMMRSMELIRVLGERATFPSSKNT